MVGGTDIRREGRMNGYYTFSRCRNGGCLGDSGEWRGLRVNGGGAWV